MGCRCRPGCEMPWPILRDWVRGQEADRAASPYPRAMLSTSEAPTVRTTSDKFQEPIMSPEASPLAMVELNSIVGILIAKFPPDTPAPTRGGWCPKPIDRSLQPPVSRRT
jgi:hypothetical protein